MYNVQLLDSSEVYPLTPIQQFSFTFDGGTNWYPGTIVGGIAQFSIALPPNSTQQVGIRISRTGYAACETFLPLNLPPLPVATFTYANNCKNDVVNFTPTVVSNDLQYYWSVVGGIGNTQPKPGFVFQNLTNLVTLTVSNRFGCSVTSAQVPVDVVEANVKGVLEAIPDLVCEGTPVTIKFYPDSGQNPPTNIYWYRNLQSVVPFAQTTAASPNLVVTQPGLYFVTTYAANGCRQFINGPVNVNYMPAPPAPAISGATSVCANNAISLSVPANAAYVYVWRRNGVIISTSTPESISEQQPPGTYIYSVMAQVESAGTPGVFCNGPATNITVTVLPEVIQPILEVKMITCDPYRYAVYVVNPQPNTIYYWSNGVVGDHTFYTHDGPVAVTARLGSCEIMNQVNLPADFGSISWSFPTGCYEFCRQTPAGTIAGPSGSFLGWDWLQDGQSISSGSGNVPPLTNIVNGSSYSLQLNQGRCDTLLGPATISEDRNCATSCGFRYKDDLPVCSVINNETVYSLGLGIGTTFLNGTVSLSVPNGEGYFVPNNFVVTGGVVSTSVIFYPLAGFNGGPVNIAVTGYNATNDKCYEIISRTFPRCPPRRNAAPTNDDRIDNSLIVAPNPTAGLTTINYKYADSKGNKTISVSDGLGRVLFQKQIDDVAGNFALDCSLYGAGIYYIVMKNDGNIIRQERLEKK